MRLYYKFLNYQIYEDVIIQSRTFLTLKMENQFNLDDCKEITQEFENKKIDPYEDFSLDKKFYKPNYMNISELGPISILCAQSKSGKTNLLLNILKNKLIFEYPI